MEAQAQTMKRQDSILSGHRLHFWAGGQGPGLLLIHAAWGDAEMSWSRVWNELALLFTVIAPDMPGFGQSSALPKPNVPAMAGLFRQLLNAQNIDRAIVVGNSFGASVAMQFAADYPDRTSHLVLVNGGYTPVMPGFLRALFSVPPFRQGLGVLMRNISYSDRALRVSFAHPSRLPSGFFEQIRRNARAYSKIGRDTWLNMTGPPKIPAVPTTLLWGAQDGLVPMKYAHVIQKGIPGSRLVTVAGAGHMPQVERPEEFIAVIKGLK